LFKNNNIEIIRTCQEQSCFKLVTDFLAARAKKLETYNSVSKFLSRRFYYRPYTDWVLALRWEKPGSHHSPKCTIPALRTSIVTLLALSSGG